MAETTHEARELMKGARVARTQGEAHFRNLLDALPVAAYTCDRDGLITYFNAKAAELWGRAPRLNDPAERYGGAPGLYSADGREITHEQSWMAKALATEREYAGVEIVIRRADGRRITALAYASPLRDDAGRVVGGVNMLVDIDERKRAEEIQNFLSQASAALAQIADYESTLERIANLAVPAFADWFGVHVRGADGKVRRIAVRHMSPEKEREVEALYRAYPPGEGKPYGAVQVLLTGEPIFASDFDALLPRVARDERHLGMLRALGIKSFLCVPLRSRGNILGALTFATAESGRAYGDAHLRAAEDLASRAAIAIENAQLLEAMKEADRRKDEFLAMLAHELRNPLAPVRNAVHILRATAAPSNEGQWAQDVIERQVTQMSRLVDDLLDVSRIARGKIELRRSRVALASVVANAAEAARPAIERGGHQFSLSTPAEPLYVEADPARLAQIFANLLTNAAKYTEAGGRIEVRVEREGDMAAVRVIDTGLGIPREMLGAIFDMFVQVDRTGEHAQGGLGIGLTLVKRLTELHGGKVEARSDGLGQGSEFIVRLPLSLARQEPAGAATGAYLALGLELGARRVLVVDDNRDAADSLAFLLGTNGCDVRVAYDGLEAVSLAAEFLPDIVLLDIGLPKLYGYDAARRIRSQRGRDVLLIAITGWGQEEDRRRAMEAGFDHHLTKPVQFERLVRLMTARTTGGVARDGR